MPIYYLYCVSLWRRTQVGKGRLCKSLIHQFESDRCLSKNLFHPGKGSFLFFRGGIPTTKPQALSWGDREKTGFRVRILLSLDSSVFCEQQAPVLKQGRLRENWLQGKDIAEFRQFGLL